MHSWAHEPLGRLLDLIDVMVVLESEHDRRLARDLALRWGLGRVWQTTIGAADALLERQDSAPRCAIWARHLVAVRERRVFETHLTRWAGAGCGLPYKRMRALGGATRMFTDAARPRGGRALERRHASNAAGDSQRSSSQSEHDRIKEARSGR